MSSKNADDSVRLTREQIAKDYEEFLRKGGKVQVIKTGTSAEDPKGRKNWRLTTDKKQVM